MTAPVPCNACGSLPLFETNGRNQQRLLRHSTAGEAIFCHARTIVIIVHEGDEGAVEEWNRIFIPAGRAEGEPDAAELADRLKRDAGIGR
jgi:hypothetical protein